MATFEKQVASTLLEDLNSVNGCINTFHNFETGNSHQKTMFYGWLQTRNTYEKLAIKLFNIERVGQIELELQEIIGS